MSFIPSFDVTFRKEDELEVSKLMNVQVLASVSRMISQETDHAKLLLEYLIYELVASSHTYYN